MRIIQIYARYRRVFLTALVILSSPAMAQPYSDSQVITDITYNWSTHDRRAPGSDNWPVTWSVDDEQLTSFGDGGGFGGTNQDGRVSLGFSRVVGNKDSYVGTNIWGGKNSQNPEQFGGKSYGILDVAGTLYSWWGPSSGGTSYTQTRLLRSTDSGATWQQSSWDLTDIDADIIMPTILNFGRGYQGSRDNYIYHYFIRKVVSTLNIHKTDRGRIDLARVPIASAFDVTQFEWFTGIQQGQPTWSSNAANRAAVFEDSEGVGWNLSVSYNAGLNRYFLMTEHTETKVGLMGMFEAPEPWGPWSTVSYHTQSDPFGNGNVELTTFFWNFSNKWMSANGTNFVMVFSGIRENDTWNSVEGTFNATNVPPTPNPPVVTDIQ